MSRTKLNLVRARQPRGEPPSFARRGPSRRGRAKRAGGWRAGRAEVWKPSQYRRRAEGPGSFKRETWVKLREKGRFQLTQHKAGHNVHPTLWELNLTPSPSPGRRGEPELR